MNLVQEHLTLLALEMINLQLLLEIPPCYPENK